MNRIGSDERADVIVLGGGLTGLALACALGHAGCRVVVVERAPLASLVEPTHDGRVTAIARGSRILLATIGVWRHVGEEAQPIRDIVVGEAGSPVRVRYDHREVGREPLGWIVPNRAIRQALMARLAELTDVRILAPATMASMERALTGAVVRLADGRELRGDLVAVCDGRRSGIRESVGIGARTWAYGQTGIVATLAHDQPHRGLAVERFFPDGPFALLPMTGNRCSIVWALRDDLARDVRALDDGAFEAEVTERMGDVFGSLRLEGARWHYPLVLVWADAYTARRLVLVGDAAHGIHPIAGQGWNLALRDVAAAAEIVADRVRLGLDPGDDAALERYAAWRRFDSLALVAITDGINRLFANDIGPLKLARNLGLGLVERTPPAKRFFMRHAMGLVGELPRAMRGLPL